MPTHWDSALVRATAAELGERLADARLQALFLDPGGKRLYAFFRSGTLEVRLDPHDTDVRWRAPVTPFPGSAALPARVRGVHAPPDERRFTVELSRVRGSPRRQTLEVELIPRRLNAVHTADGRVEAALRSEPRLERGAAYAPPEGGARPGADGALTRETFEALQEELPADGAARALLSRLAWSSPLNAAALVSDREGPEWGWALWRRLADGVREPVTLEGPGGPQRYPVAVGGLACTRADGLLDAEAAALARPTPPSAAMTRLTERVTELERRIAALEREADAPDEPAELRARADLLLARLHTVPKGEAVVTLEGFDGSPVQLELDPARSPRENADDLYEKAGRAERAREALPERIARTRESLERVQAGLERARSGTWTDADLKTWLGAKRPGARSARKAKALPYRPYRSSGGLDIWVGRGARHNDELTFHVSRPGDVWMHARDVPGAHVVLRWDKEDAPPARDLAEAAALAALHSGARHSALVPVDWTRRRYVRKPRGAKPGSVRMERASTVMARPDPDLAERLAVEEG